MKKPQKKNAAKGKAAGTRESGQKPAAPKTEYRAFTMAEYRTMEKVANALSSLCRLRRKYVAAMQAATESIDRNLDRLREIVWNDNN